MSLTELKFKLSKIPDDLKNPYIVKEIYLHSENQNNKSKIDELFNGIVWNKIYEIRISAKVTQTCKIFKITLSDCNSNIEFEKTLTEIEYNLFSTMECIGMYIKLRYDIPVSGTNLILNVDNYIGSLFYLITAEIEYDKNKYDEDQVRDYVDKYLGDDIVDITSNSKYKCRNLATLNNIVQTKIPK